MPCVCCVVKEAELSSTELPKQSVVWVTDSWLQLLLQDVTGPDGSSVMLPVHLEGLGLLGVSSGTQLVQHSGVGSNQTTRKICVQATATCLMTRCGRSALSILTEGLCILSSENYGLGSPHWPCTCARSGVLHLHSFPGVFCSRGWRL